MKKYLINSMLISFMLVSIFACNCIKGEGPMRSESRSVKKFTGIELDISANVYVEKSRDFYFEIEAQESLLKLIKTRVEGRTLHIYLDGNCLMSHRGISIKIGMPEVDLLDIGGSGSITLEDQFTTDYLITKVSGSGDIVADIIADEIECDINGSGSIELLGETSSLEVDISGSGDVDAIRLKSRKVYVDIHGSGGARVHAADFLRVDISGSGDVRYRGKPDIDSNINGSGDLIRLR
ncbi:MAG: hypothetical protein CL663_02735 [Bacteroidetes bacterium]|nr:hypothetical protein [Bacteroidota bacterium]